MNDSSGNGWASINVDPDVLAAIEDRSESPSDSPNDVLRRVLLLTLLSSSGQADAHSPAPPRPAESSCAFARKLLDARFAASFDVVRPWQYMFESNSSVVYFQNYNEPSGALWFRLHRRPWQYLADTRKQAWLCFTNPRERLAYFIPVAQVVDAIEERMRGTSSMEVHIDTHTGRWTEFDLPVAEFRFVLR